MKKRLFCAMAMSTVAFATAAHADVVIMRKQLKPFAAGSAPTTPSNPTPTPSPTPTPPPVRGDWITSAAVAISPSCSAAAPASRNVWCAAADGTHLSDAACSGEKPAALVTIADYSGCGYEWNEGPWSAWSSSCSDSATRTRTVSCRRSDGATVDASSCSSGQPATSESGPSTGGCSYGWQTGEWSGWSSQCSADASRTRSVSCIRSDGSPAADAFCAPAPRPAETEAPGYFGGCSFSWDSGEWGAPAPACGATVQNREVTCMRADGTASDDASCDAASRPSSSQPATDYSTCTYGWATGSYGAWSTTCGAATRTRSVSCQSSDGRTVEDSQCSDVRPEAEQSAYQTDGCGHSWTTGEFGPPAAACGATTQTRTVACVRSDGQTVDDASCEASSRPASSQPATDYSTCSYEWSATGWSQPSTTCGQSTQTRTVTCQRSDGVTVSDANCVSAGTKPESSETTYPTGGCSYAWQTGNWGPTVPACGTSYQGRTVSCRRSDGETVDDSYCGSGRPATTQNVADYSTCMSSNTWRGVDLYHSIGAAEGTAWTENAGVTGFITYGPYQQNIAPGTRTVTFLVRIDQIQSNGLAVTLDAVGNYGNITFGTRVINGSEVSGSGYQAYTITYTHPTSAVSDQLEYRVYSHGAARVSVASISIN